MTIMDAGVHVWRPQAPDRPWMPGRKAHLPDPLTYEKFSAMMKEPGVKHAILVPPSWEGDRVDYSLEAAQKYPNRFAVMGRLSHSRLGVPDLRQALAPFLRGLCDGSLVGASAPHGHAPMSAFDAVDGSSTGTRVP
jgi:predicted TIM-barrel fold metal-dependent hydrolase